MDFLIDSITRKNTRISFFYLTVYFNRNRFNGLTLFVRCTVCNADMFAFLKLRQLANISCIRCFDASFDIDDTARHSCFARLTHRFTDGNDTVIAIRLQDVPLRHLAAVAESRRVRDAIFNLCVVTKCHILAITGICLHTNCDTGIAGTGAFTYSQRIVLGFRIRANSYGITAICQSADTGCQRVRTLCTIVVVVASLFIRGIYTVEMRLSRFQLSHVDGIRILRASCDVSNLARGFDRLCLLFTFLVMIFHFTICATYRNGTICGYPRSIVCISCSMGLSLCIIANFSSFGRSNGA